MVLVKVISPHPLRMTTHCGFACLLFSAILLVPILQAGFQGEVFVGLSVIVAVFGGIFPRMIRDNFVDQDDRNIILRKSSLSYHDQKGKMIEIPRQVVTSCRQERRYYAFAQDLIIQSGTGTHKLNLLLYRKSEAELIQKFFEYQEDQWTAYFAEWLESEQKRQ